MTSSKEKRVILFLVEGQNDEAALIPPFKKLIDERARVFSQAFHCDVTTAHLFRGRGQLTPGKDVCETVRTFVLDYLRKGQGYAWKDIDRIIHIVDTDGAFIPPDSVVEDDALGGIVYSSDRITCPDKEWVVRRNTEKSKSLNLLVGRAALTFNKIKVPYAVYYLSRNFEHALFGIERELSNSEKDELANRFRQRYENDIEGFVALLDGAAKGVPDSYRESWDYIKHGARSLERHSNLIQAATPFFKSPNGEETS